MRGVFLSYRRDDSMGHAGRLYDRLVARFGRDAIFRDIDTIAPGADFPKVLRERVEGSAVVLVIIGRHWLDARNDRNQRRLEEPGDFVRQESEMALARGTTVIPVLVDGARMPSPGELPESIRALANVNAVKLDEDTFDYEVDRLAGTIAKAMGPRNSRWKWWAAGAAMTLALVAGTRLLPSRAQPPAPQIATARAMADAKDYKGAWDLLTAHLTAPGVPVAREDLAMEWLRGMGARDSRRDPVLPAVVDLLAPVLTAGAEQATGTRKADLLAHYGWSLYLHRRRGADVDAAAPYRQALAADPANPFANVMLGHWIVLTRREQGLNEARKLFRAALDSGRERATVRRIQMAGIENIWDDATDAEYLRVAGEMVESDEPLDDNMIYKAQSVYYFAVSNERRRVSVTAAQPAPRHVALLRYIRDRVEPGKHTTVDLWIGRMEEAAGRPAEALAAYQRIEVSPSLIASWKDEILSARKRLSARNSN